uniref:Signal recognition particle SRP72 subunit RNA-binding domain-containing protein n=1 Tax=Romanomermis culicivorax TaxID=13658 RepID=A0A915IYA0_ROMCU
LCKSLPDLDHLTQGIDVDKLENAENLVFGSKYGAKKAAKVDLVTPKVEDETLITQKKKKRNRKIKLPQKYDPNIPPDPERWLPKYERSTYRKRKDKRAKDRDIGRGTQGAVSDKSRSLTAYLCFILVVTPEGTPQADENRQPRMKQNTTTIVQVVMQIASYDGTDSTVKTDPSSTASPKPGSVTPAALGPRQQRPLAQKPKKKKKAGKWT